MTGQKSGLAGNINCETCQEYLPEYVRRELANEPVERLFSDVAFHIETCPTCEAAYYRMFRKQGLQMPLSELQRVGDRAAVAGVLDQILNTSPVAAPAPVPTDWRQVALDVGRGWIDRATGAWQQVEIRLSSLGAQYGQGPSLALAGLQRTEIGTGPAAQSLHIAPEQANFELWVSRSPTTEDAEHCRLEVAVTLADRFGDYGGVGVTLLHGDTAQTAVTDSLGKVVFPQVPCRELDAMRLRVRLAEE